MIERLSGQRNGLLTHEQGRGLPEDAAGRDDPPAGAHPISYVTPGHPLSLQHGRRAWYTILSVSDRVTCLCLTTARRTWTLARALVNWRQQTYEDRHLIVVSDGEGADTIAKIVRAQSDARIRHVHYDSAPENLGAKHNLAMQLVPEGYLAWWADDDWNDPARLAVTMCQMQERDAPIGGSASVLAYRLRDRRAFVYRPPPRYLVPGTVVARADVACRARFSDRDRGEDYAWITALLGVFRYVDVADPQLYVALIHHDNTGNSLARDEGVGTTPGWHPWPEDIGARLGW